MGIEHIGRLIILNGTSTAVEAETAALAEMVIGRNTATNAIGYSIDNGATWVWLPISAGATAFTGLTDAFASYTGLGGQYVKVKATEDGLETGAGGAGAALSVEEADGTPTVANVTKIKVTNGSLTDNTGGTVTLDFGSAATDGAAIHDNVASEIHAITEKTTLADNDEFVIEDSADSYNKKRVKKSNLGGGTSGTPVAFVTRTKNASNGNDYAISNGSFAEVDSTNLRLTIAAVAGDVLEIGVNGYWQGNVYAVLTAATIVSNSPVNYIDTANGTPGNNGVNGWCDVDGSVAPGPGQTITGSFLYTVQAGDVSGGNVVMSLIGKAFGAGKTLFTRSGYPLQFFVKNLG